MSIAKRLTSLEKAIEGQGPPDEGLVDPPDWREQEARRLLPMLRWMAVLTQYEDHPIPDDAALIEKEVTILRRFDTRAEYHRVPVMPDAMIRWFDAQTQTLPGFNEKETQTLPGFTYC